MFMGAIIAHLDVGRFQFAVHNALLVRAFQHVGDLALTRRRWREAQHSPGRRCFVNSQSSVTRSHRGHSRRPAVWDASGAGASATYSLRRTMVGGILSRRFSSERKPSTDVKVDGRKGRWT
jgi:hypothetical protein